MTTDELKIEIEKMFVEHNKQLLGLLDLIQELN